MSINTCTLDGFTIDSIANYRRAQVIITLQMYVPPVVEQRAGRGIPSISPNYVPQNPIQFIPYRKVEESDDEVVIEQSYIAVSISIGSNTYSQTLEIDKNFNPIIVASDVKIISDPIIIVKDVKIIKDISIKVIDFHIEDIEIKVLNFHEIYPEIMITNIRLLK
jgi:hypothetical protein